MIFLGIGIFLIFLPFIIGGFIVPLYYMIWCLKNGGDWQYYRDEVIAFLFVVAVIAGFVFIGIGLM